MPYNRVPLWLFKILKIFCLGFALIFILVPYTALPICSCKDRDVHVDFIMLLTVCPHDSDWHSFWKDGCIPLPLPPTGPVLPWREKPECHLPRWKKLPKITDQNSPSLFLKENIGGLKKLKMKQVIESSWLSFQWKSVS